jgi:hypothetical protein
MQYSQCCIHQTNKEPSNESWLDYDTVGNDLLIAQRMQDLATGGISFFCKIFNISESGHISVRSQHMSE